MTSGTRSKKATEIRASILRIVGDRGLIEGDHDTLSYTTDWLNTDQGKTPFVVRPSTVGEVSEIVRLCAEKRVPIVPQGGNTGLVKGSTPSIEGDEILLSLSRLNKVRDIDASSMTAVFEAGVTLKDAQDAADRLDLLLPVSIASEGSAQIGGIVSTNAGGIYTMRFGNTRRLVLGLEVVLPDGSIWHGLRRLRKDNTGYSLANLFVGAEGTLGIVTAAALELVPAAKKRVCAFCALPTAEAMIALLRLVRSSTSTVWAFEYMCEEGCAIVREHHHQLVFPVSRNQHYALIEFASESEGETLEDTATTILAEAFEQGIISDAALSHSESQRVALWAIRELHTEAQKLAGPNIKHDVSVPVSAIPDFLERATRACKTVLPSVRVAPFGHVGDGNIHFNLVAAPADAPAFLASSSALSEAVYEIVNTLDGSFSAEHGIGTIKKKMMLDWRDDVELNLSRSIRNALDPSGVLNPRVLLR